MYRLRYIVLNMFFSLFPWSWMSQNSCRDESRVGGQVIVQGPVRDRWLDFNLELRFGLELWA